MDESSENSISSDEDLGNIEEKNEIFSKKLEKSIMKKKKSILRGGANINARISNPYSSFRRNNTKTTKNSFTNIFIITIYFIRFINF